MLLLGRGKRKNEGASSQEYWGSGLVQPRGSNKVKIEKARAGKERKIVSVNAAWIHYTF